MADPFVTRTITWYWQWKRKRSSLGYLGDVAACQTLFASLEQKVESENEYKWVTLESEPVSMPTNIG